MYFFILLLGESNTNVQNFLPRLKDHLYARVQGLTYEGDENDFTDAERNSILITDNKLFEHSIVRINYTTYDLRRDQDSINPRTRADLMVMSHEEEQSHPYWYARLIKIFHVNVEYHETPDSVRCRPKRMDFLFVRWFKRDMSPAGFTAKRLQRLEFFDDEHPDAYGFLDPECVIRGVHIIPGFAFGRPEGLLVPTIGRREADPDWVLYYVNMYACFFFYILRTNYTHGTQVCRQGYVYEVSRRRCWPQGNARVG